MKTISRTNQNIDQGVCAIPDGRRLTKSKIDPKFLTKLVNCSKSDGRYFTRLENYTHYDDKTSSNCTQTPSNSCTRRLRKVIGVHKTDDATSEDKVAKHDKQCNGKYREWSEPIIRIARDINDEFLKKARYAKKSFILSRTGEIFEILLYRPIKMNLQNQSRTNSIEPVQNLYSTGKNLICSRRRIEGAMRDASGDMKRSNPTTHSLSNDPHNIRHLKKISVKNLKINLSGGISMVSSNCCNKKKDICDIHPPRNNSQTHNSDMRFVMIPMRFFYSTMLDMCRNKHAL